jgi:hypothetical protein
MYDRTNDYNVGISSNAFAIFRESGVVRIGLGTNRVTGNIGSGDNAINVVQVHGALVTSNITTFTPNNTISFSSKNVIGISNLDFEGTVTSKGNVLSFSQWSEKTEDDGDTTLHYEAGRVGIGTSTVDPSVSLHVEGMFHTNVINFTDSILSNGSRFITSQWTDVDEEPSDIYFIRGNVGIGTLIPKAALDVTSDARIGMSWVSDVKEQVSASLADARTILSTWTATGSGTQPLGGLAWSPQQRIFIAASNQNVLVSSNGLAWATPAQAPQISIKAITWVPEYSLFVALPSISVSTFLVTTNGSLWTSRDSGIVARWNALCWSSQKNRLVAVGPNGVMVKVGDPNTNTWISTTPAFVDAGTNFTSVAWSPQLGMFVAVADTGSVRLMSSPDGMTWTGYDMGEYGWSSVTWSAGLSMFLVTALDSPRTLTSTDGANWVLNDLTNLFNVLGLNGGLQSVAWSPQANVFIATGLNRALLSTNGIQWSRCFTGTSGDVWGSAVWSRELSIFCAVSTTTAGTARARILVSAPILPTVRNSLVFASGQLGVEYTSGNLGIGTTTPLARTHIFGSATAHTGDVLRVTTNDTSTIVNASGNVGIGTTVATQPLHVNGRTVIQGSLGIGATYTGFAPPTNGLLVAGSVGIGTSSPLQPFHITGRSYFQGAASFGAGRSTHEPPTNGLLVEGNVGIGTTTVGTHMLRVEGSGFVSGAVETNTRFLAPLNNTPGAPVYSFGTNTNTGMYNPANNVVAFSTSGSERVRITSGGSVGIGTNAPFAPLHVEGRSYMNGNLGIGKAFDTSVPPTNGLIVEGNVGIGTAQAPQKLTVEGEVRFNTMNANDEGSVILGRQSATDRFHSIATKIGILPNECYLRLNVHNNSVLSTACTILGTGNIGMGVTNPTYKLQVDGDVYSSSAVIAFSDARVKTDIEPIQSALDKVCAINGYTYSRIDEGDENRKKRHAGVLAQEVEKVLPEVVYTREDGFKAVAYGNMIALMIEAIKELKEMRACRCCCKQGGDVWTMPLLWPISWEQQFITNNNTFFEVVINEGDEIRFELLAWYVFKEGNHFA